MAPAAADRLAKLEADMDLMWKAITALQLSDAIRGKESEQIISRLDRIDGHLSKLLWAFIAGFVTSAVVFVVNGGLVAG